MGYVEQNLMSGEDVTYRAGLHWIIYSGPAVLGGLGVLLVIVAGLFFLSRWITSRTSEFAVTNKRVIIKVGLIRRHTVELLLGQVESIGVDQSIVGGILGYGSIVVIGTGGTREPFKNIAKPLEFRKQVQVRAVASADAAGG